MASVILKNQDFPDGPVVKTDLPLQGVQIQALDGELRSHMRLKKIYHSHKTH